jgi:hypothetical protein
MRLDTLATVFAAALVLADAALACEPVYDERSLFEIRSVSKPVAVDPKCRAINAGVYDELSLGPATDLGRGRIQQVLGGQDQSRVLLVDCNTRELTILQGAVTRTTETSCGPVSEYADLAGAHATMPLDREENLHDLVEFAKKRGVTEINPLEYFFKFAKPWETERHAVGRKDRFDLLCGCKLFYPDSPGAKN